MANISIIGTGYIGRVTGLAFKGLGHRVIFYSATKKAEDVRMNHAEEFTNDINYAIKNSDVSFITKATPTYDGKFHPDLLLAAAEEIGKVLKDKKDYHLVVVRSTVVPTFTEMYIKPILEKFSGKECGKDFGLDVNPEFIVQIPDEVHAVSQFFNADRVVIGEHDKKSGDTLEELYRPLSAPIIRTDMRTAEMIKYAANIALAAKISYWNEIFYISKALGIDADVVAKVAGMDRRIGHYGTKTGKAFGGRCLPKDLEAFVDFAKKHHDAKLLQAIYEVNKRAEKEFGVHGE